MKCENCQVDHDATYGTGRFCSEKCARGFATKKKRSEINEKVSKKLSACEYKCRVCGKDSSPRMKGTRNFCSEHKGIPFGDIPFENLKKDSSRKSRLVNERSHRCERCGITEWMGLKCPLELHHVDGHPGHNEKDNLQLLCANCHSQQDNNTGANVGHHKNTKRQTVMARYPDYRKRKISLDMPE